MRLLFLSRGTERNHQRRSRDTSCYTHSSLNKPECYASTFVFPCLSPSLHPHMQPVYGFKHFQSFCAPKQAPLIKSNKLCESFCEGSDKSLSRWDRCRQLRFNKRVNNSWKCKEQPRLMRSETVTQRECSSVISVRHQEKSASSSTTLTLLQTANLRRPWSRVNKAGRRSEPSWALPFLKHDSKHAFKSRQISNTNSKQHCGSDIIGIIWNIGAGRRWTLT